MLRSRKYINSIGRMCPYTSTEFYMLGILVGCHPILDRSDNFFRAVRHIVQLLAHFVYERGTQNVCTGRTSRSGPGAGRVGRPCVHWSRLSRSYRRLMWRRIRTVCRRLFGESLSERGEAIGAVEVHLVELRGRRGGVECTNLHGVSGCRTLRNYGCSAVQSELH